MSAPLKVVYLFGAGATHAEVVNLYSEKIDETFLKRNGLLMYQVSNRVCEAASKQGVLDRVGPLSPDGLSNIELFISLLEKNEVRSESVILRLQSLLKKDILGRLKRLRAENFYLHKALFELHAVTTETFLGIISLNYDNVIDEAYRSVRNEEPNYCLTSANPGGTPPLLKLHGGFHLKYRDQSLPIMTPGINKNYLELPYNFVWGRALELLIECDVLRVIGCSLSQNDIGLIDLFFKAHRSRVSGNKESFEIQIIDFDPDNNTLGPSYGFLPSIKTALKIEGRLISDVSIKDPTTGSNPFKIWLKAKAAALLNQEEIRATRYIKQLLK